MKLLKRKHIFRRYGKQTFIDGYPRTTHEDIVLLADVQTMDDSQRTTPDGTQTVQRLKVFCDTEILIDSQQNSQKADRLWFQNKWFDCISCRLSENTPLRHYTCTFVELLDNEAPPEVTI